MDKELKFCIYDDNGKKILETLYEYLDEPALLEMSTKVIIPEIISCIEKLLKENGYLKFRVANDRNTTMKGKRCYKIYRRECKEFWISMYDENDKYSYIKFTSNGYVSNDDYVTHLRQTDCFTIIAKIIGPLINSDNYKNIIDYIKENLGSNWLKIKVMSLARAEIKKSIDTYNILEKLKGNTK